MLLLNLRTFQKLLIHVSKERSLCHFRMLLFLQDVWLYSLEFGAVVIGLEVFAVFIKHSGSKKNIQSVIDSSPNIFLTLIVKCAHLLRIPMISRPFVFKFRSKLFILSTRFKRNRTLKETSIARLLQYVDQLGSNFTLSNFLFLYNELNDFHW